jgi:UDP-N-acetylmuramyl tripeptide synthase
LAARALGIADDHISMATAQFRSDARDNPGRANEFSHRGARVFVDFAHNPHSIAAVTSALAKLPASRRFILLSHAGDRSDADIRALTDGAFAFGPDFIVIAENAKYLRGRSMGEVPDLIRSACLEHGFDPDHVILAPSPSQAAGWILDHLHADDLALLLVHDERDKIFALLD